ncbi:hypothetical protein [Pacificoceanicola onchidii]|uniref:hypothetical protein n=1 Tax=Pacificoceanicola onchidii TaxID=2562685 RepID=UPI0010A49ACB|nr:hypothetical protein [Pacificoceanicola onchidii]
MIAKLSAFARKLWAAAPIATVILVVALGASLFFGVRSAVYWVNRPPIAERQQPIESWMTPRYVVRSWRVPREVVLDALLLERPLPGGPVSLSEIAELRGVPVAQVITDIETAIAAFQAEHGPKPEAKPETGADE